MGLESPIEWCHSSKNLWQGCHKIGPECKFCYADRDMRRRGYSLWGKNASRKYVRSFEADLLKWNAAAAKAGENWRIFINSNSDFFEDHSGPVINHDRIEPKRIVWNTDRTGFTEVELALPLTEENPVVTLDDLRAYAFHVFGKCPNLTFLLLTKRPERIVDCWPGPSPVMDRSISGRWITVNAPRPPHEIRSYPSTMASRWLDRGDVEQASQYCGNVWIGTTVGDQEYAKQRLDPLMECRDLSPVLYVSCEPLLTSLDLRPWLSQYAGRSLDWVISGCETKSFGVPGRPSDWDWFKSLEKQCSATNTPFFLKQAAIDGKVVSTPTLNGRQYTDSPSSAA